MLSISLCIILTLSLSGMMLGGGCGRELAHWIIHGRPEKDMYGYDIRYVNAHKYFMKTYDGYEQWH